MLKIGNSGRGRIGGADRRHRDGGLSGDSWRRARFRAGVLQSLRATSEEPQDDTTSPTANTFRKRASRNPTFILRDWRQNEMKPIDPALLDLLVGIQHRLATKEPFQIISGYRTPKTNAMLHFATEGVAVHSLHLDGKAIDICVEGRSLRTVHARRRRHRCSAVASRILSAHRVASTSIFSRIRIRPWWLQPSPPSIAGLSQPPCRRASGTRAGCLR